MHARGIGKQLLTGLLVAAIVSTATISAMQAQLPTPTQEELDAAAKSMNEALDLVKSVVSGDLAAQGFRPGSYVLQEMFKAVPALAAKGALGADFDPNWLAVYYPFGSGLTAEVMTSLRDYAVQVWLLGHSPGFERFRATLALPDMYELPVVPPWRHEALDNEWIITKMKLVGVYYNVRTHTWEQRHDSVHHVLLVQRIMAFDEYAQSRAAYKAWVQSHQAGILLLVGQRGLDGLMRHGDDLQAQAHFGVRTGDPNTTEKRDRAWLLFVFQQLVEFADTAEEYVRWLEANKGGLIDELSEVLYNELLGYARAFVELSYRGLRAGEIPPDMDPVAMALCED